MPLVPGRPSVRESVVAGCLLASLGVAVWGFARTDVLSAGMLRVWDRASAMRFVSFLALAGAALALAAWTRVARGLVAVIVVGWIVVAFGLAGGVAAGAVLAAALGLGSAVAAPAQLRERFGQMTGAVISLAAGLAVMIAVMQVLVRFSVNTPGLYVALVLACMLGGRRWLERDFRAAVAYFAERPRFGVGAFLILIVLAVHTVFAALPEHGFDALAMHLAIPTYVASHARWGFDAARYVWAFFPMGGDWLYTANYLLGGEYAARLFNLAVHGAVVALLHAQLRQQIAPRTAALLTAAYAASPLAMLESATLFVENPLSLFLLATTVLVARSWRAIRASDLVLVGLLLGAGLATKLFALFAAVPLVAIALASAARSQGERRVAPVIAAAVVFVCVGSVPYVYAWWGTGNPVFPLMNHVFRSAFYPPVEFRDERWVGHLDWKALYETTFRSGRFGEHWNGAFGFQHLLFLPAGIVAAALSGRRAGWVAITVGSVYLVAVAVKTQYLRYFYPVLPLLAFAHAEGARLLSRRVLRIGFDVLAVAVIAANLAFMPTAGFALDYFRVDAVISRQNRERYEDAIVPQRKLLRIATATDGKRVRVLQTGQPVGVDLAGEPIYLCWYNLEALTAFEASRTREDLRRFADRYGLTHVLDDGTRPTSSALAAYLETDTTLVHRIGNAALYRVRPRASE